MSTHLPIVHSAASHFTWWLAGLVLLLLALWGWPLILSNQFENHFYGLFYYSILAGMFWFWSLPSEQRFTGTALERRIKLWSLIAVKSEAIPIGQFDAIRIEQDPNLIGADSLWLVMTGPNDTRFAFASRRDSPKNRQYLLALAQALSNASKLPLREDPPAANATGRQEETKAE